MTSLSLLAGRTAKWCSSDFADVRADLHLCCLQIILSRFSLGVSHLNFKCLFSIHWRHLVKVVLHPGLLHLIVVS